MNAEEQQKKGTSDKIRGPEPEKWKQTDNAAEQKQQRRCKTPEEPMRDCNDDHGISGCQSTTPIPARSWRSMKEPTADQPTITPQQNAANARLIFMRSND